MNTFKSKRVRYVGLCLVAIVATAVLSFRVTAGTPAPASLGLSPVPPSIHSSIKLGWDQKEEAFTLELKNQGKAPMTVDAVQGSRAVWFTSVPVNQVLQPGEGRTIGCRYISTPGNHAGAEYVGVKTSQGDLLYNIVVDREQVARLTEQTVIWHIGDPNAAKTVEIVIEAGSAAKPVSVHSFGRGSTATLRTISPGHFAVDVKPGSTQARDQFPVLITYEPDLPGSTASGFGVLVMPADAAPAAK